MAAAVREIIITAEEGIGGHFVAVEWEEAMLVNIITSLLMVRESKMQAMLLGS